MKHFLRTFMKQAGIVLLLTCALVSLAGADVVGTLNVHTASDPRPRARRRPRPRSVGVFCGEESPIVPQLFCPV